MEDNCVNIKDPSAIDYWTTEDKFNLLQALKVYSYQDLSKIREIVPNKSEEELQCAIEYYKEKILEHPIFCKKVKKAKKKVSNLIPLAEWAKFLTDTLNFKELHTETATAIRVIADFEDFPPAICTNNIDFKTVYHTLANALEGKALPKDKYSLTVMEKCLLDTALTSKAFIRQSSYKNIIKSINMSEKAVNCFPRPTENQELAHIRHLASQRTYNPFNIAEDFLKPTS
ncbi:uncharacterized protein [Battus philenor]|uniref:uncharacterized protein n=1 Tax=Battus philenor TaxID=42288 RepID=UPI0035CFB0F5